MFSFLKDHPFAVEAFFESSLVLTFAIQKQDAEQLVPECLEVDSFNENWAFLAVAMVQTKNLRPKGFPGFSGSSFFLVGYRIFVRFKTRSGKILRGLYILKSETDKKRMEILGNMFTHYNYSTTDIWQTGADGIKEIGSEKSGLKLRFNIGRGENIALPVDSPFANWQEAQKFAGPLPFTFTYRPGSDRVLIIEGVRKNWKPRPVQVMDYNFSFIDNLKLNEVRLANAFIIQNVPYYWKKGRIEPWMKNEENFRAS